MEEKRRERKGRKIRRNEKRRIEGNGREMNHKTKFRSYLCCSEILFTLMSMS